MKIHILDRITDSIVDFLENKDANAPVFWDFRFVEKVKNGAKYVEFATSPDASPYLVNKNKLVIQHPDGYYMSFVIEKPTQTSSDGRELFIEAEPEHMRMLTGKPIEPITLEGETIATAMDFILSGTRWKRGITEYAGTRKVAFDDFMNPLKAVLELENIFDDVEVRFRIETAGGRIVGRYVDFLKRIGRDEGAEVVLGINLVGIERQEDSREVYTAMYGVGKGKNEGEFVTFESINGGKKYIEDKDALQRWSDDGQHLFGIWYVESENDDDPDEEITPAKVLDATRKAFRDNVDSKVSYKVESIALPQFGFINNNPRLGDTVRIKDEKFSPPLYLEARVLELEWIDEFEHVTATFGNYREILPNVYDQLKALQKKLFKTNFNQLKRVFSSTEPTDDNVIWVDLSGDFPIVKLFDPTIEEWIPAGPEVAGDLGAYTKTEVDNKYEPSKDLVQAWKNPDSTEFDGSSIATGTLSFSQARGGILHLGAVGGGELHMYEFNSDGEAENIGEIVKEGASFPKIITQELVAPDILRTMPIDENLFPEITYYVNPVNGDDSMDGLTVGTPKRTIQSILNKLPRYLSGDITIIMEATGSDQQEDLEIKGFGGDGIIRITSESGYKTLEGKISMRHCTNQLFFSGVTLKCPTTTDIHVKIETCNKVEFRNVKLLGENKADDGIRSYYSKTTIIDCEAYRYKNAAFTSAISNHLTVKNCKGSDNKYGVWAYDGGIITGGGTCPTGTTSQTRETYGHIMANFTNDGGTTPSQPPTSTSTVTKYFNASSSGAWRENYGGQWYQSTPYQGKYNSWGRYKGLWFHGSQLSVLSGKTIKSIKIKVKRQGSGGHSGDASVVFRTHNYSSQPGGEPTVSSSYVTQGFGWTDEEWVDVTSLKSAFQNGTAKGFGIYTSSTSNSNYAIFTGSCQVKVTYEE